MGAQNTDSLRCKMTFLGPSEKFSCSICGNFPDKHDRPMRIVEEAQLPVIVCGYTCMNKHLLERLALENDGLLPMLEWRLRAQTESGTLYEREGLIDMDEQLPPLAVAEGITPELRELLLLSDLEVSEQDE